MPVLDDNPDRTQIHIRDAQPHEAARVAEVVRAAFEGQCRIYEDWTLPPMSEDEASVLEAMRVGIVLVAEDPTSQRIIGTVRARDDDGRVEIGRLAVEPDSHGRGIGRRLTEAAEERYPSATRFELGTGHLSRTALSLYESLGYVRTRETVVHDRLTFVWLVKTINRDTATKHTPTR